MRKFRLLKADEIECRIAQTKPNGVQLLLYKTARTDAALLDETYPDQWQCDFKALDGKMYGGIGIKINNEWLWRWDCGAESNMEAEKGEASDAFKRAGFKWGLGTELYSSPFIWVKADDCKIENGKCYDRFRVANIEYDGNERIVALDIDNTTQRKSCFHMGAPKNSKDELAERSIIRTQILALADGDVDRINSYIERLTKGEYKNMDGLTAEQLASVKIAIVRAKQNAGK
jgi:hypothetical protein